MLFNSLEFAIFLPIVVLMFFTLPHNYRWLWLLLSSCVFYMAYIPWFILVIGTTIFVDYFAGIFISKSQGKSRKFGLVASLIVNIGILFFFKYFNFFFDNLFPIFEWAGIILTKPDWKILLPVGLSFHTFQAMSYTIEVYRNNQPAERHFGVYALYVMFFPQMVAGPIERPQNMLHQFHEKKIFNEVKFFSGLRLMMWGFFKKLVIADRAAIISDEVFANPDQYGTLGIIWASALFAFRIYCDFSGYTDIARGAARMMGFELIVNFKRPYLSTSVTEFWRRWHISLSTWFRDYVYIPIGGSKRRLSRVVYNLLITFLISGLWHGADWKFVIWGGLNGIYISIEYLWNKFKLPDTSNFFPKIIGQIKTFLLVGFSWIFFAAPGMEQAWSAVKRILHFENLSSDYYQIVKSKDSMMAIFFIFILMSVEILIERKIFPTIIYRQTVFWRWLLYIVLVWTIILFGQFSDRQFIYFVF
jgi:D-alanyl-lipoteichoic acid acyltransferase DltB (MBOAT superfamily)